MKIKSFLSLACLLLLPLFAGAQCAMCRAVLESSGNQAQAEGINQGIMYLMIWPYILIGGIGFFVWRTMRNRPDKAETNQ